MAIDPNSFDEPVKDYVFDQTKSVNDLIEAMAKAGGFTATKLARAKDLLKLQFEKLEQSTVYIEIAYANLKKNLQKKEFLARVLVLL